MPTTYELECPSCGALPFRPEDGCGACGLGRAYPVPQPLDPGCYIARGWASGWPNTEPPTEQQVGEFVTQHGHHCPLCRRYRMSWRRVRGWMRRCFLALP